MIKKYKSLQEADNNWVLSPQKDYYDKINDFFVMIEKLSGFKVKRGIQKIKNPFDSLPNTSKP